MQQKTEPKRVRSLSFGIERLGLIALRYPLIAAGLIIAGVLTFTDITPQGPNGIFTSAQAGFLFSKFN